MPLNKETETEKKYSCWQFRLQRSMTSLCKRNDLVWHYSPAGGDAPLPETLEEWSISTFPLLTGPLFSGQIDLLKIIHSGLDSMKKKNNYPKNVNINVQRTWFPNL